MPTLTLLSNAFTVLAPVFVVAAIGYGWHRARLPYDSAFITTFAINVSSPCLVFSALTRLHLSADVMAEMTVAAAACMGLTALLSVPVLLASGLPLRVYVPAMAFPNAGNLGLPVCLFAFGETGLSLAVLFYAVMAVCQFTLGPALAAGRFDLKQMLRTPTIYAVALAVAIQLYQAPLPVWIADTTTLLGNCAVPLMLLSLGVALARLRLSGALRALSMSAFRLVAGFAIGLLVAWAMGLSGPARGVVLVQSSMPVAVFNYLWALRYDNSPEDVAGMVLGSTAMAFVGLPALMMLVMQ
ncbi:AEC family transporter [Azospirillum picis]|uniref:Permease n=1 Tax=Azospirillum picis TaxID=488438 RepID=A0ABU0MI95_9PROT|nr:AEC family transporter [Azospirillum picis]MBP2299178.1 putative permease [Azospirillum picis]MDQ0533184.1 putative permease [Azospirillum picis]